MYDSFMIFGIGAEGFEGIRGLEAGAGTSSFKAFGFRIEFFWTEILWGVRVRSLGRRVWGLGVFEGHALGLNPIGPNS